MDETLDIAHEVVPTTDYSTPEIVVLKFSDSKIPIFRESRNKDYIKYGEKNYYPEYLGYLFDKSAKHNAIINGKADYIFGEGYENGDFVINRLKESLNDISKKCILDAELYGGWRIEVVYNALGKIAEIYHVDYRTLRVAKQGGFYYKEAWNLQNALGDWEDNRREEEEFIPEFDPTNPTGSQIYAYNLYRPGTRYYPLPSYIGCLNYVETDIEISKFHLSAIRNGMAPSKMIQFFKGEPPEEKKREIERRMQRKFAGSEAAGKFILVFNDSNASKSVEINDLSASDLDKQFEILNKTCQQEIFSGHRVTSPMLFGIKTEGQLGGATELATSYAIFQNTYANPKAATFDKEINYLLSYSIFPGAYELRPTDPVGIQFDIKDVINALPKQFVFERLGVPKDMWELPNIGSDNKPTDPAAPIPAAAEGQVNEMLRHLSAKQLQNINRIKRQYKKGVMNVEMAKTLLRGGYGFSEDDINNILELQQLQMSAQSNEDFIVGMFDACGDSMNDFEILRSKKVSFNEMEAEADEAVFIKEAFKTYDVTTSENKIIELIKKDKRITPEVIAKVIGETPAFVQAKISDLVKRGYLETSIEKIGIDEIIERTVPKGLDILTPPPTGKINPTQVFVKYAYEVKPGIGPAIIPTSRPFCIKMVGLHRLYSRADIETISERLGYSVFDRKGGWWGDNPECRHRWVSHIVVKKGGQS